jgi:LPXTG-site transpeptidase (sortase) family protein
MKPEWLTLDRLTQISVGLILFSLIWMFLTVIPVLVVEAKYQSRQLLSEVFNVSSVRELLIPNFDFFDVRGQSQYTDYGITIPAIYLDEKVIFNVDPNDKVAYTQALTQGIAHASSTAFPDSPGLGYYFAHSTSAEFINQFKAVFYLLGKLKSGDEVFIWHEGKSYEYVVSRTQITQPSDISFLDQGYPTETIVLQTCWPPGTTRERLLVFAERKK